MWSWLRIIQFKYLTLQLLLIFAQIFMVSFLIIMVIFGNYFLLSNLVWNLIFSLASFSLNVFSYVNTLGEDMHWHICITPNLDLSSILYIQTHLQTLIFPQGYDDWHNNFSVLLHFHPPLPLSLSGMISFSVLWTRLVFNEGSVQFYWSYEKHYIFKIEEFKNNTLLTIHLRLANFL